MIVIEPIGNNLTAFADAMVSIDLCVVGEYGARYDSRSWTQAEFLATRPKKESLSFALFESNKLTGFSIAYEVNPGHAHISRLAVMPSGSRGLGSMLLDFQLAEMKKKSLLGCSVDLARENSTAFNLYESRGFLALRGNELAVYVHERGRDVSEYLTSEPSHIAMVCKFANR